MAGRKLNISGRLRGSTIIEVVISMVVIIMVFGIAMMIYGNVTRSSLSVKKIKAEAVLQARLSSLEQNAINLDDTVNIGDFQVEEQITVFENNSNLSEIHLIAWDNNHVKVAELQKVIINHD